MALRNLWSIFGLGCFYLKQYSPHYVVEASGKGGPWRSPCNYSCPNSRPYRLDSHIKWLSILIKALMSLRFKFLNWLIIKVCSSCPGKGLSLLIFFVPFWKLSLSMWQIPEKQRPSNMICIVLCIFTVSIQIEDGSRLFILSHTRLSAFILTSLKILF